MKLIFCLVCEDIVKLVTSEKRTCRCGRSSGMYDTDVHATISGPCIPFGISNHSWHTAIWYQDIFNGFFYGLLVPHHGDIAVEGEAVEAKVEHGHIIYAYQGTVYRPSWDKAEDEQDNQRDTDRDTKQ